MKRKESGNPLLVWLAVVVLAIGLFALIVGRPSDRGADAGGAESIMAVTPVALPPSEPTRTRPPAPSLSETSQPVAGAPLLRRRFEGTVTAAPDGGAIRGASIRLYEYGFAGWERLRPSRELASTVSDEAGAYQLDVPALPRSRASRLILEVQAKGHEGVRAYTGFLREADPAEKRLDFKLAPGGRISGTVLSTSRVPIAGATITALTAECAGLLATSQVLESRALAATAVSESDGRFLLDGVRMGANHHLVVTALGYFPELLRHMPPGIDQLEALLTPGEASLRVVVLEADGRPAAGVIVNLGSQDSAPGRIGSGFDGADQFAMGRMITGAADADGHLLTIIRHPSGVTDTRGEVHFDALRARLQGVQAVSLGNLRGDRATLLQANGTIELTAGTEGRLVLRFPGPTMITGRAIDAETGEPLAGVRISDTPYRQLVGGHRGGLTIRSQEQAGRVETVTGSDGRFTFPLTPAGSFMILHVAPPDGYFEVTEGNAQRSHLPGQRILQSAADGTVPEQEWRFAPGSHFTGIVSKEGKPVADADVTFIRNMRPGGHPVVTVRTGTDGRYRLTAPSETFGGLRAFAAEGTGFQGVYAAEPRRTQEINIGLRAFASISGTVTADGAPLEGVGLVAIPTDSLEADTAALASTDKDGYYFLEQVTPGPMYLGVEKVPTGVVPPEPRSLVLEPGEYRQREDFDIEVGRGLRVRVVDPEGLPISGVHVSAEGSQQRFGRHAQTDSGGEALVTPFRQDEQLLGIQTFLPGYNPVALGPLEFPTETIQIVMHKAADVLLTVLQGGQPVTDYELQILTLVDGNLIPTGHPLEGPRRGLTPPLRLSSMSVGTYELLVQLLDADGERLPLFGVAQVVVPSGEVQVEAVLEVDGGRSVEGTVRQTETREPVPGALVRVFLPLQYRSHSAVPTGLDQLETTTDAAGRFRFGHVAPFAYRCTAGTADMAMVGTPLVISHEGDQGDLLLLVAPTPIIRGSVIGSDGNPLAGASIRHDGPVNMDNPEVLELAGRGQPLQSDAQGRFELRGLLPGLHRVQVTDKAGAIRTEELYLQASGVRDLEFDFSNLVELSGRLLVNGQPVTSPMIQLQLVHVESGETFQVTREAAGYRAMVRPGAIRANYRRPGTAGVVRVDDFELGGAPREQSRDFDVRFISGDVVLVFPRDEDFSPGMVSLSPPESDFKSDYFTAPVVDQPSHRFNDLLPGPYIATFRSRDGKWRGDSEINELTANGENVIFLDVERMDPGALVGRWSEGELHPTEPRVLAFDVTPLLTTPGPFRVAVQYTGGNHAAVVLRASLFQDGRLVSQDQHRAWTGYDTWRNLYNLVVPSLQQGSVYTLEVELRSDGGDQSRGEIHLIRGSQ